jgi:hypothetical protein
MGPLFVRKGTETGRLGIILVGQGCAEIAYRLRSRLLLLGNDLC